MIYWLKRLEWKIRKRLGFVKYKKRVKTIADVSSRNVRLLARLIILAFSLIVLLKAGEIITKLWWWFFPRIVRAPTRYL